MVSWTKKNGIDSSRKQLWKMDTLWKHNIDLTNKIYGDIVGDNGVVICCNGI